MRLVGEIKGKAKGEQLTYLLNQEGVEHKLEESDGGFYLWVLDDENLQKASQILEKASKESNFSIPAKEIFRPIKHKKPLLTLLMLFICIWVFLLDISERVELVMKEGETTLVLTPIEMSLLFDVNKRQEDINKFFAQNPIKDKQKLSKEQERELKKILAAKGWDGVYSYFKPATKDKGGEVVLFKKIRQGEIWRLITPIFLHGNLIHILFNGIWLWVLGKQIEFRLSRWRYLFLIFIIAIITNVAQYLVSGPLFLGYSGVLMGQIGFIWSRQKVAPWEGYPLQREAIYLIALFVLAMVLLEVIVFGFTIFNLKFPFEVIIANTAHIVGAIVGAYLGRLSFFARESHI